MSQRRGADSRGCICRDQSPRAAAAPRDAVQRHREMLMDENGRQLRSILLFNVLGRQFCWQLRPLIPQLSVTSCSPVNGASLIIACTCSIRCFFIFNHFLCCSIIYKSNACDVSLIFIFLNFLFAEASVLLMLLQ